jgi:hypothetical protein
MRTNSLSKIEGGETVSIIRDGYVTEYTNIKNMDAYLTAALSRDPSITGYIYNGKTTNVHLNQENMEDNMEDRIQINGVWYAKEESDTLVEKLNVISQLGPGVRYDGFVFESDFYAFDCTRIYDEDGNLYKDGNVCIKFTDKSKYSGLGDVEIGEIWDNVDWMRGIIENEVEAIEEAMQSLCSQGFAELKEVLTTLRVAAWI